jgi:hypothetical protein
MARDHARDAIALVRLLRAGKTADASFLLGAYTGNACDQEGLCGSIATVAMTLAAYIDGMAKVLAQHVPDYPVTSSDDVLTRIELLFSQTANGNASQESSRGEAISYL